MPPGAFAADVSAPRAGREAASPSPCALRGQPDEQVAEECAGGGGSVLQNPV